MLDERRRQWRVADTLSRVVASAIDDRRTLNGRYVCPCRKPATTFSESDSTRTLGASVLNLLCTRPFFWAAPPYESGQGVVRAT
jgi:hypothetical protein